MKRPLNRPARANRAKHYRGWPTQAEEIAQDPQLAHTFWSHWEEGGLKAADDERRRMEATQKAQRNEHEPDEETAAAGWGQLPWDNDPIS